MTRVPHMLEQHLIVDTHAAWVELCLKYGIDFEKSKIRINKFGGRFEVIMPEILHSSHEEEE